MNALFHDNQSCRSEEDPESTNEDWAEEIPHDDTSPKRAMCSVVAAEATANELGKEARCGWAKPTMAITTVDPTVTP